MEDRREFGNKDSTDHLLEKYCLGQNAPSRRRRSILKLWVSSLIFPPDKLRLYLSRGTKDRPSGAFVHGFHCD